MAINTTLESASTTAASNGPSGSDQRTLADDGLRQYLAFIKSLKTLATLASATTVTPPSTANAFSVTGTTAITTIASTNSWDGRDILFIFAGILTLTNGSNLILPGSANITTAVGDAAWLVQVASGQWRCVGYSRADGTWLLTSQSSLTLSGNLTVNGNTAIGNANTDTLTVAPDAVTWSNNPTHSGNHTYSGNLTVNGNTALGNAGTDTVTTQGNVTVNVPSSGGHRIDGRTGFAVTPSAGNQIEILSSNTSTTAGASTNFALTLRSNGSGADVGIVLTDNTVWNAWWGVSGVGAAAEMYWSNTGTSSFTKRLALTSDGRFYGTALHNNAGAVTGTTNQYIASGEGATAWTATTTNTTNVTASSWISGQYIRSGNVVGFSGTVTIDPTTTATYTEIGISLPIASNFASAEAAGTACLATGTSIGTAGFIGTDATNDRLILGFTCPADTASRNWTFSGHYCIK